MRGAAFAVALTLLATNILHGQRRTTDSPAAPLYRDGMRLLADEHWRDAADTFERAIALDDEYALAFYGLGRARIGERQYVAAIGALERCSAIYLAQAGDRTARQLGNAQRRQDQIRDLRDQLRELQAGPQRGSTQLLAQQIQNQIYDLELAMRDGIELTLRVPAFVSLSLGSAHFRRGSMPDAEREYRNALRANPKMGEAHSNLAVVLLMTGRPDAAAQSVRDAERAGHRVHPQLKEDIRAARRQF